MHVTAVYRVYRLTCLIESCQHNCCVVDSCTRMGMTQESLGVEMDLWESHRNENRRGRKRNAEMKITFFCNTAIAVRPVAKKIK